MINHLSLVPVAHNPSPVHHLPLDIPDYNVVDGGLQEGLIQLLFVSDNFSGKSPNNFVLVDNIVRLANVLNFGLYGDYLLVKGLHLFELMLELSLLCCLDFLV